MDSITFQACRHNMEGKGDGCLLFDPSDEDPMLCDCCHCHRNFHLPLMTMVPQNGACTKLWEGHVDGCQLFIPADSNARKCAACDCHRSFHKPAPLVSPTHTPSTTITFVPKLALPDVIPTSTPSATVVDTWPSSFGDVGFSSDQDLVILEPLSKKSRLSNSTIKLAAGSQTKLPTDVRVKLEFPELSEKDYDTVTGDFTDLSIPGIPRKLKKNWLLSVEKYPVVEYGRFYPRLSENRTRGESTWILWCEPCEKEMAINPGGSFNLSNFEIHLQPRKTRNGASVGSGKHELAFMEKKKKAERALEAAANAEAAINAKRSGWILKHSSSGAEMVDENHWRCKVCDFSGKFGGGDTIAGHMKSIQHTQAVRNSSSTSVGQFTINEAFANGVKSGKAEYPSSYIPSPEDIPHAKLLFYFEKHICHGFYPDSIMVNKEHVDISAMKNDLHSGNGWYADSQYTKSVVVDGQVIFIKGTFRHVDCTLIFCKMCSLIPHLPDFRKRVFRSQEMTVPRGQRFCQVGTNLEYLQRPELIHSVREWESRMTIATDKIFLLNVDLARATTAKDYLSCKLKTTLTEGSLPEIAELFLKVSNSGGFANRDSLYNLLVDVARNLLSVTRKKGNSQGKRYHPSTIKLFEILQNFGGSAAHNFLSKNLLGPVLNTSRSIFRKEGFLYSVGLNAETFIHLATILKKAKTRLGITSSIPFECSEDETKCVELATLNRRLDIIDGFCGLKDDNHKCLFDVKPSAVSWDSITTAFKTLQIGSMCRVLICNPLISGLPRLVYCIFTTCNKFDAVHVREQWAEIAKLHKTHLETEIGPLRGHGSDGDSRRRKLMLQSIYKGNYGIDVPGFLMKAEMVDNAPLIMMQDPLHVGKKLRNPLLNPNKSVFWGQCLAHKNHLELVMESFGKDEHGLLEEDVSVKDKQNFPAVQRIAFPAVRDCLQTLQEGVLRNGLWMKEAVLGTIIHTEVIWAFLEIFFGRGTLTERVIFASFVCHMLYMGTEYIIAQKHGHTVKANWISNETRTDCLIACHSAVSYIRMMRDFYPELPIPLDKVGSDCCEDFFSLLGQQVKNKHTFCVGEALERCSHIGRTEQVRHEDEGIMFVKSRRRTNMWWKGNALVAGADLMDYKSLTDDKVAAAWNDGFSMAQDRATKVNMKATLMAAGKWDKPWPSSFSHESLSHLDDVFVEKVIPSVVCDSQSEVAFVEATVILQSSLLDIEQQRSELILDPHTELDSMTDVLDNEIADTKSKHSSVVEVPGKGSVYKMRLISELNLHHPEKLPLDRLRRVRYRTPENQITVSEEMQVGLFDDVGMLFEECPGNLSWHIGRIQKIVKGIGEKGGKVDYVRAVSLSTERITFLPKYYKHIKGLLYSYGGYEGEECDMIELESIICIVSITVDAKSNIYTLAKNDYEALNRYVNCETERQKINTVRRKTSVTIPSGNTSEEILEKSESYVVDVSGRQPQGKTPKNPQTTHATPLLRRSGSCKVEELHNRDNAARLKHYGTKIGQEVFRLVSTIYDSHILLPNLNGISVDFRFQAQLHKCYLELGLHSRD